jgi:predicted RNA-binding Zn-ribbon protein involved in translation (DUF1610 family)
MTHLHEDALLELNEISGMIPYNVYSLLFDSLDEIEPLCDRDEYLEGLWMEFEDVPMDPETERIEKPFLRWKVGTSRDEIWQWFDQRHSKGVHYLLYGNSAVDRTYIVTEVCPSCGSEIEMRWNTDTNGFRAFCPVCGNKLMLCDECIHAEDSVPCDYDECTGCYRAKKEGDRNDC